MQPWPSPRSGGASRKRLRGEPKRNAVFALLQRETASVVLGGRRLRRAGGAEPPSTTGGSRMKGSPPAGGKQCVKDRYRMAGTPRGPVRLWLKRQQGQAHRA